MTKDVERTGARLANPYEMEQTSGAGAVRTAVAGVMLAGAAGALILGSGTAWADDPGLVDIDPGSSSAGDSSAAAFTGDSGSHSFGIADTPISTLTTPMADTSSSPVAVEPPDTGSPQAEVPITGAASPAAPNPDPGPGASVDSDSGSPSFAAGSGVSVSAAPQAAQPQAAEPSVPMEGMSAPEDTSSAPETTATADAGSPPVGVPTPEATSPPAAGAFAEVASPAVTRAVTQAVQETAPSLDGPAAGPAAPVESAWGSPALTGGSDLTVSTAPDAVLTPLTAQPQTEQPSPVRTGMTAPEDTGSPPRTTSTTEAGAPLVSGPAPDTSAPPPDGVFTGVAAPGATQPRTGESTDPSAAEMPATTVVNGPDEPDANTRPGATDPAGEPWWVGLGMDRHAFDENARQRGPIGDWMRAPGINPAAFVQEPSPWAGLLPPKSQEEVDGNNRHARRMERQSTLYQLRRDLNAITPVGGEQAFSQLVSVADALHAADVQHQPLSVDQVSPAALNAYLCVSAVRCEGAPPEATVNAAASLADLLGHTGEMAPDAVQQVLTASERAYGDLERAGDLARAQLPDARLATVDDPVTASRLRRINQIAVPGATADLFAVRLLPQAQPAGPDGTPLTDALPGVPPELAGFVAPRTFLDALGDGSIAPDDLSRMETRCQEGARAVCESGYRVPGSSAAPNELVDPRRAADLVALNSALSQYWQQFRADPSAEATTQAWTVVEAAKTAMIESMLGTASPAASREQAAPTAPAPSEPSAVARLTAQAQTEPLAALYRNLPSRTTRGGAAPDLDAQRDANADADPITRYDFVTRLLGPARVAAGDITFPLPVSEPPTEPGPTPPPAAQLSSWNGQESSGRPDPAATPRSADDPSAGGVVIAPDPPRPVDPLDVIFPGGRPGRVELPDMTSPRPDPIDPREFDPNGVHDAAPRTVTRTPESFPVRDDRLEEALGSDAVRGLFRNPGGRQEALEPGRAGGESAPQRHSPGAAPPAGVGVSAPAVDPPAVALARSSPVPNRTSSVPAASPALSCDASSWVACPGSPGHPAGEPRMGPGIAGPAIVGPQVVGPKFVGPGIVGPGIVGPGIVGPGIVGAGTSRPSEEGSGATGPALVGPRLVGPRVVGPEIVGVGVAGPRWVGPKIVGPAIVGPKPSLVPGWVPAAAAGTAAVLEQVGSAIGGAYEAWRSTNPSY